MQQGGGSCTPSSTYTAASLRDECLLCSYISLLFTLLCTEKTSNSDLRPKKHPMGEGRTVLCFFLLRREGKTASLSQQESYQKKCQVCQKPPRTSKRRTKNRNKLSAATKPSAPPSPPSPGRLGFQNKVVEDTYLTATCIRLRGFALRSFALLLLSTASQIHFPFISQRSITLNLSELYS